MADEDLQLATRDLVAILIHRLKRNERARFTNCWGNPCDIPVGTVCRLCEWFDKLDMPVMWREADIPKPVLPSLGGNLRTRGFSPGNQLNDDDFGLTALYDQITLSSKSSGRE